MIYKPNGYNSLSPYLIIDDAQRLIEFFEKVLDAKTLRRFEREDGKIAHIELKIDDTVLMMSDSSDAYPANTTMLHFYVPDVLCTFAKAVAAGCQIIEAPVNKDGDPDTRGSFYDLAGNYWAVSTPVSMD
jgi:PhnB protein